MIKDGVILIDAGTSSEDGKMVGDIDKEAYQKASFVSPVPGGVGPMTIAILMENLVKLNS
jgi:methylenetetrahydrofolate dehydrogenase (NADP+)/methenyltetrahydrofolate cyclohydrolase